MLWRSAPPGIRQIWRVPYRHVGDAADLPRWCRVTGDPHFGSAVEHEPGELDGGREGVSVDAVGNHGERPVTVAHEE